RGTFSNKRFGQGRSADMQQFYCEVCKISCAGAQTYKEHMDGQKHKKKEAMQKGEGQTLSKSRVSFRCETCNVTCTGKDTYESHVRGSKHQKVIGVPTVKFVGGEKLQNTAQELARKAANAAEAAIEASGQKSAAVEAALAAEKEVQPVGEDYVEEERNESGKLIQYSCKLCDCKFSDPNAKNIHIKGRKHRLQYKIYPEESQLTAIEKLVSVTEKALKAVSDNLAQEETKKPDDQIKSEEGMPLRTTEAQQPDRILKGVMRVGLLAKGLLLKTDREVQLVVLCSQPPTRTLLSKVVRLLPQVIENYVC
ncbi:zinc finger, C2H2 type, partial [Onchocerca flexuosa]